MSGSVGDYLTEYRQFFENFALSVDPNDQLPVKLPSYNLGKFEITGEILDWCLQYLNQRRCPSSLLGPLCYIVSDEIKQDYEKRPDTCGYRSKDDDFLSLQLMQGTIRKLIEVCRRYLDNAKLCSLPPPPLPGTILAAPISVCAIKNSRRTMEDRHVAIQDLHSLFNIKSCGSASYYGVFDGHNGVDAAAYSVSHLHQFLVESPHYPSNPELAIVDAFLKTDRCFIHKSEKENLKSGTTAVVALLRPSESMLYVAWLGDSQAMLVTKRKAYQLVKPHKPDQPEERQRIEKEGGSVVFWGTWRVNGQLAVSRAIGDLDYKPVVSAQPDVRVIPLTGQEEYLVLACDGLWDVMSEMEVQCAIEEYLDKNPGDVKGVSESLVQKGKQEGSTDNISVLVVFLKETASIEGGGGGGGGGGIASSLGVVSRGGGMSIFPEVFTAGKANGRRGGFDNEEDFGPETDVDSPEDVLIAQNMNTAKSLASRSPLPAEDNKNEVAEGEAVESDEDSEEEWDYIRGEGKEVKKTEEELSESDMESRLNPNAAEFVPTIPLDLVISSSPLKGTEVSLEDIVVPTQKEFEDEISHCPSEVEAWGEGKSDPPTNGQLEDLLKGKKETGQGDAESPVSSTVLIPELEKCVSPKVETNPFLTSGLKENFPPEWKNDEGVENDFVQNHFSPVLETTSAEEVTRTITSEGDLLSSSFAFPDVSSTITTVNNENQEINLKEVEIHSPYDFVFNGEKSDMGSPVDQKEAINQEPTSSSGFGSESNEEVDTNNQDKFNLDIGITFGDGVDIEEIRKLKQDPTEESDERELKTIGLNDFSTQEVLSPFVNIREAIAEPFTPFDDLKTPDESPEKEDDDVTGQVESPGLMGHDAETSTKNEIEKDVEDERVSENVPLPVIPESSQTVDFIHELQFSESVKEPDFRKNEPCLEEAELEESFEIINPETCRPEFEPSSTRKEEHLINEEERIPDKEELLPVEEGRLPVEEKYFPIQEEHSPIQEKYLPIEEEDLHVEEKHFPIQEEHSPIQEKYLPIEEEHLPIEEEHLPIEKEHLPIEEEHLPVEEKPVLEISGNELLITVDKQESVVGDLLDQIVSSKKEISELLNEDKVFDNESIENNKVLNSIDSHSEKIIDHMQFSEMIENDLQSSSKENVLQEESLSLVELSFEPTKVVSDINSIEIYNQKLEDKDHSEVMQVVEDLSAATPPPTPAPGLMDEKNDFLSAAFVVAGATAVAAGASALSLTSGIGDVSKSEIDEQVQPPKSMTPVEEKVQEKVDIKKNASPSVQKATKTISKSPAKPSTPTTAAAKKPTTTTTAPKPGTKPASVAAKPSTLTSTKPSTPTTPKATTMKASTPPTKTTSKPLSKSPAGGKSLASTTSKTASKPTTPTAPPKAKPADVASMKNAVPKTFGTTSVPSKPKPTTTTSKPALTAKTVPEKSGIRKDEPLAVKKTTTAKPTPSLLAKTSSMTTKPAPARPASSSSSMAPSKPASKPTTTAKPLSSQTKPAMSSAPKPAASSVKSSLSGANKPALKTTSTALKPAVGAPAKPKVPATTANKTKPLTSTTAIKKTAVNDKSVKDAANNKLSTKAVPKKPGSKAIKDDSDKKKDKNEKLEPLNQDNSVTTTNGHMDIIENGVQIDDSSINKPHPEIIEAQLI